jgi:hypothetical protein
MNQVYSHKLSPYGLPIKKILGFSDMELSERYIRTADMAVLWKYSLKPAFGSIPGKCGKRRNYEKSNKKKKNRRYWKKRYRKYLKTSLNENNLYCY